MIDHKTFQTPEDVVASLAQEMLVYSEQGKPVHISISGGSAPKVLFKRLSQAPYAKTV